MMATLAFNELISIGERPSDNIAKVAVGGFLFYGNW